MSTSEVEHMEVEKNHDQTKKRRKTYFLSYLKKVNFQLPFFFEQIGGLCASDATPLETNIEPENVKSGCGCSFLKPPFSGCILNLGAYYFSSPQKN